MQNAIWFIHLEGETFGPVNTSVLQILLKQNRLQFADFVWTPGLTRWTRVADIHEFASLLPAYPTAPFPESVTKQADIPIYQAPPPAPKTEEVAPPPPAPIPPAPKKPKIRKGERVAIEGKAVIEGFGSYDVINISENGLFVEAGKKPIPVGTDIKLKLEAKQIEKKLELYGVVVREANSDDGNGFAVEFIRVNPAFKRIILDYIESQFK